MEKDFNTGLRKSLESDRIKLTRRRKQLLREMGYSEDLDSAVLAEKLHEQVRANDVLNRSITRQEEEIKKLKARIVELETGHRPPSDAGQVQLRPLLQGAVHRKL